MGTNNIENLSELECDLLIDELTPLDSGVKKKVDYVMKVAGVKKQTALEYVVNDTVQLWAKVNLDWTARDYQIPILEQGKLSKRLVLRLGRRLGKCVDEETELVNTKTGTSITVKELLKMNNKDDFSPASLNKDLKLDKDKRYAIHFNGIEDTYKLDTVGGYSVTATDNHPFLTIEGWKELSELKEGDYIATIDKLDIEPSVSMKEHEIKFLAYMIGDGSTVDRLYFHNTNEFIQGEMNEIVSNYNCTLKAFNKNKPCNYTIISNNKCKNEAIGVINKYGLRGRYSHNKHIPSDIFGLDLDSIAIFLNRLFSTDGCISTVNKDNKKQSIGIKYSSTSEKLIKDIRLLLLRFGIKTHMGRYKNLTPDKKQGRDIYILTIKRLDSIILFLEKIGMVRDLDKQESLLRYCKSKWNTKYNKVPSEILTYIENVCTVRDINYKELMLSMGLRLEHFRKRPSVIQKDILVKVADYLEDNYLTAIANSSIHWDKIKKIEYAGKKKTYDLSVEENKNFLCGPGIVTHNTEDMCILILWHAFRQPNAVKNDPNATYDILILTPYETQIDLIFDRLNQLIDGSPSVTSMMTRRVHHRIEFDNKAFIRGLTLGVGTGKEGSNTRGQKASLLVYDEVDQKKVSYTIINILYSIRIHY